MKKVNSCQICNIQDWFNSGLGFLFICIFQITSRTVYTVNGAVSREKKSEFALKTLSHSYIVKL